MNKIAATIALVSALSLIAPNMSLATTVEQTQQEGLKKSKKDNAWNYKGVSVHVISERELSPDDKRKFELDVDRELNKKQSMNKEQIINESGTYAVPAGDGGATTISGPTYKTHNNTVTNFVIESAVRGVSAYLLKVVYAPTWLQGTVQTWLSYVHGYLQNRNYVYVGYKTSKAYNSYYGYYEIYETLVFYSSSSYTSPTNVYYYGTGQKASNYGY